MLSSRTPKRLQPYYYYYYYYYYYAYYSYYAYSYSYYLEEAEEVAALVYLGEACGIEEHRVVLAQRVLLPLEPREHLLLVDALDVGAAVAALRLVRRLGEVLRLRAGG